MGAYGALPAGGFSTGVNQGATAGGGGFSIAPQGGGSVLGASIISPSSGGGGSSSGGSGGKQNGGWYWDPSQGKSVQYWAPGSGPSSSNNAPQQNQGPSMDDLINGAYNDAQNMLNGQESGARSISSQISDLINNYAKTNTTNINNEQTNDQGLIDTNRTNQNKSYQSALSQAGTTLNQLYQQAQQRFGSNSAAQGVMALANQQYVQNRGNLLQQNQQDNANLDTQGTQLHQYIGQKLSDNENQMQAANLQNQQNLQQELDTINASRTQTAQAKAAMKLDAIQSAASVAQQVASQSNQFKQSLTAFAIQQQSNFQQRGFTPTELSDAYNGYMGALGGNTNTGSGAVSSNNALTTALPQNTQDYLKQLGILPIS